MVHDVGERVTYLAQRHYGGVRRLWQDTGVIDIFCVLPGIRCLAIVLREQRTTERHLVCCIASAVYTVSRNGVPTLLAGSATLYMASRSGASCAGGRCYGYGQN
jgi:hypothetical protein